MAAQLGPCLHWWHRAGLHSSSVFICLEHPDENTYTLNVQWCFLAQQQLNADDGRWFAEGRHCGDRLELPLASLRTDGTFTPDCLGPSCFLIAFCYLLPFPFLTDLKAVACCVIHQICPCVRSFSYALCYAEACCIVIFMSLHDLVVPYTAQTAVWVSSVSSQWL